MAGQAQKEYPATQGLLWFREQYYSFFVPYDWHRLICSDYSDVVIFGPDPADPFTVIAVHVDDIGCTVTPDDFDILADGFFDGIEQLPELVMEARDRKMAGTHYELEAKYSFREEGDIRKRWMRVFYYKSWQIAMTAQGATPEIYDYWLPIFFEAMMTARIHSKRPAYETVTYRDASILRDC